MATEPATPRLSAPEAMRQDIEALVEAIDRLSKQPLSAPEFHTAVLERVVPALAAVGGVVWTGDAGGALRREAAWQLDQIGLVGEAEQRHLQLIRQALRAGEAKAVPPMAGHGGDGAAANPTGYLLLLSPIANGTGAAGLIEVFQRPGTTRAAQAGYQRFLAIVAELAGEFHSRLRLRELEQRAGLWGQFEQFASRVHCKLDLKSVAFAIANEGRRLVGCDRLSVARMRGSRCRLLAVSGQDTFEKRANLIRRMEQLATAVVAGREPLWYAEDRGGIPPQVELLLEPYLDESHSRMVAVVPLFEPEDEDAPRRRPKPVGALVVERFEGGGDDDTLRARVDAVRRHGELAIHNALSHQSLPFFPVLRLLQKSRWLTQARQLPKTLLVLLLLAGAVAALVLVPADFEIGGRGELQPALRRDVFAPSDGVVDQLHVGHADAVAASDPLIALRRSELDFEFTRVTGELLTTQSELQTTRARYQQARPTSANAQDRDARNELAAKIKELEEREKSLNDQLKILQRQQEELVVRSPIAGEVLTWDVETLLDSRPVKKGQALLRVGDTAGDWVLEVRVPDDDVGHVLAARESLGHDLKVSFVLTTDPDTVHEGTVREIAKATETHETEGASVLVTVAFDRDQISQLRPGATVVPRIYCGRRAVGYVWFHDLWDALKTYVLF